MKYQRRLKVGQKTTASWFQQPESGFTLVELLLVIGAVSILLSIMVPALGQARRSALQNHCSNNLKKIGTAVSAYADDHAGRLPGPAFPPMCATYSDSSSNELVWYLTAELRLPAPGRTPAVADLFICPSQRKAVPEVSAIWGRISYLLAENIGTNAAAPVAPFGVPGEPEISPLCIDALAEFGPPGQIPAITDLDKGNVDPKVLFWGDLPYEPVHGRVRNQLYFDGHVEAKPW